MRVERIGECTLMLGDCIEAMASMQAGSVSACVCDPPYGLEFMGKEWDRLGATIGVQSRDTKGWHNGSGVFVEGANGPFGGSGKRIRYGESATAMQQWHQQWATAVLRVLKPGGYMLAFGGTRTFHRLTCAIEDAGFEIRDCLSWLYGQGFPKAKSCLKPAWEPIILARKPGPRVEPLSIDGCRIAATSGDYDHPGDLGEVSRHDGRESWRFNQKQSPPSTLGRWPANVVLDEQAAELLDEMSGELTSNHRPNRVIGSPAKPSGITYSESFGNCLGATYLGEGGASRFLYVAKASRADRGDGNNHPTVKPLELMRWLVRLITQPGDVVLDPFLGSGTTAKACAIEGRQCIGIEREPAYFAIAVNRLNETEEELATPLFEQEPTPTQAELFAEAVA